MTSISANGSTDILYIQQSGSNIQYKINSGSLTTISSWPCTITNTNLTTVLKVLFLTNITLNTDTTRYFACGSKLLQFGSETLNADGTIPTITVDGITGFLGLIRNGSGSNGYNDVSVYNLFVTTANSATLASNGGWIGQSFFSRGATGNLIVNCSCDGSISGSSGGIVGSYSANNGGTLTIRGCSSTGSIANNAGGIIAESCSGSSGSSITIERCWSSGSIGAGGGGITGNSSGINGGSVSCTDCYSTGSIGGNGGGIFGITNGYGTGGSASATNCYSTGDIAGSGGGIFGGNAGTSSGGGSLGSATASNCYTKGAISSGAGGIFGSNYGSSSAYAYNCYTTGSTSLGTSGGIWPGSGSDTLLGATNYAEGNHNNSGWSDTRAKLYLTGEPVSTSYGTTWSQPNGVNTEYVLTNSGYSPYSVSLTNSVNGTVVAGNSTSAAIVTGYTYSFLQINNAVPGSFATLSINSSTGAITASSTTPATTYTILIYNTKNPYGISTYILTVSEAPVVVETTTTTCCVSTMDQRGLDYAQINDYRIGNRLLLEVSQNPKTTFDGYSQYVKYKMAQRSRRY